MKNSRQWKKDNKEAYNKYMHEYRQKQKEEKLIQMD